MLSFVLSLRFVMLIASVGSALGALLMLLEGGLDILDATLAFGSGEGRTSVITSVMHGIDAFLFGVVLVIFAYAIAFGFVFDPSPPGWERLPSWMRITSVSELKTTLVEVILLYLLVDFATDWPEIEGETSWQILAKPTAILAIALAFGLFGALHALAARAPATHAPNEARGAEDPAARRSAPAPLAG